MKALVTETCSGVPGIVTEPRIAARCLVPAVRWRLPAAVSIGASLPDRRIWNIRSHDTTAKYVVAKLLD
jgi:hypothetical protein